MLPNDWFEHPPFLPELPLDPKLEASLSETCERLRKSKVAVITAKEGGGERFIDGVDNYLSIYRTTPRDPGPLTMVRIKERP